MTLSIPALLMLLAPIALATVMLGAIELIVRIETRRETRHTGPSADARADADIAANDAVARSPWDFGERPQSQSSMTWIEDGTPGRDPRGGRRL